MKLNEYLIDKNKSLFAQNISAFPTHVYAWEKNIRKIPLHFALAIEKVTNGMVSVNELPLSNSAKKTLEQINNNV